MGGERSQKLRPWRGIHSSLGPLQTSGLVENQHSISKTRTSAPKSVPAFFLFETSWGRLGTANPDSDVAYFSEK